MERSLAHRDRFQSRGNPWARLAVVLALMAALWSVGASPVAFASTTSEPATAAAVEAAHNPDKLYIDADSLVYDKDHNSVTANGAVVLYYKNRVLQADHVVYDRLAKRVRASGRVKFTDEHGNITYSPRFDLTDDFANGFADSVREIASNQTRFTSPRIERSGGSITVLNQGVYTACEPCKAHPEWPPLWQVRAGTIIENQETHTIYFRDAYLDFLGVPVAYVPYLSVADPTVTRQSGVLAPSYTTQTRLGVGVSVPYFFNLAPNYDLTITPSEYSLQGPALDVEWRHRVENGEYSIRLSGIDQLKPSAFLAAPYGASNLSFRGSAESKGRFYINESWKFGWDVTFLTDRFYLTDYRLAALDPTQYYFQDVISQAYLRGQEGRGFFDFSVYNFQTTSAFVDNRQEPYVVPTLDYHRTFELDPDRTYGIGGELTAEFNAVNVNRTEAIYQAVGVERFDNAYNLYNVCSTYTPGKTAANCLLRGIGGEYTRATEQVSWQRKYVDPLGEVWKPFAYERISGSSTDLDGGRSVYASNSGTATIPNYAQPAFFNGASSGSAVTGMGGVGLEYRYPFVSNSAMGQQIIEPIAQIIVRPNEQLPRIQPNEDAQSLVFDETTLFAWDKYSGYDRTEGGTRLNYGAQYTANFNDGGHLNVVAGQSVQLAGRNSFTIPDAANTGLESGLDKRWSNIVAGETLQPFVQPVYLTLKQQFNQDTWSLQRFDAILTAKAGGLMGSLDFGRYAAQPLLGWAFPREGVTTTAAYKFDNGFSVSGAVGIDMSRHFYDTSYGSRIYPTNFNLGVGYEANNCATLKVSYASTYSEPISTNPGVSAPPSTRDQTVLFELDLRTLGDVKGSTGVN